jgi:indoleamine 2,3-dioxygenase
MAERADTLDLERFDVAPDRGFLPDAAPLPSFPPDAHDHLHRLDDLAEVLPGLLDRGALAPRLHALPEPPAGLVENAAERELLRAYSVAGFLVNAYVHSKASTRPVPAGVAVPLYEAATRLDRTPVLSYDGYVLHNWRLADPEFGVTPPNLRALTTFTSARDEEWFIAVHAAIEATAGRALAAVGDAQGAALHDDPDRAARALATIAEGVGDVVALLERMPENNDPEQYAKGFRPYLGSIDGVEYECVPEFSGEHSFRGASAAQSSALPALDAALGIDHSDSPLVSHLRDLRADMPPAHRSFVKTVEDGPDLRSYATGADDSVRAAYDDCVNQMVALRERHLDAVKRYLGDSVDTGTSGIPYGRFLDAFIDDTRDARL